ncbi:ICOS ligand-like isoform X2 [Hypanus sabinus]|uniref:ICOS ligand-like isoform X2 n=1 Tax=Hypanus sabinus TaxID=79690 RepID=UPI0028C40B04|nr:ICOS ligand-like isoform X2 [Hypanus sabinus]
MSIRLKEYREYIYKDVAGTGGPERLNRVTQLVLGLFGSGILLSCCRAESLSTHTVTGIVGESSLLPCLDSKLGIKVNNEIRVYWQVKSKCIYAFYSGQEHPDQNYSHRAKLFSTEFKQGNFSLLLTDLQVSDEANYICLIQLKTPSLNYDVVLQVTVTLQIAAHYKDPELTVEGEQNEGKPMRLTCSSCGGYPKPTVHWTSGFLDIDKNRTAKVYTNCSSEHLCNITSTLRIHSPVNNVTCKIYNAKLKENKTATYVRDVHLVTNKNAIVSGSETHQRWTIPMVIIVVILVLLAIYVIRRHFNKSSSDDRPAQEGELDSFVSSDPAV